MSEIVRVILTGSTRKGVEEVIEGLRAQHGSCVDRVGDLRRVREVSEWWWAYVRMRLEVEHEQQ